MRKIYFALAGLLCLASASVAQRTKLIIPQAPVAKSVLAGIPGLDIPSNKAATGVYRSVSKTDREKSTLAGAAIGSASNVYSTVRTSQNQVTADNATGTVAFIHRSDVSVWGGSNGTLRYDCSTDKGLNWSIDQGPLNPQMTQPSRYPSLTHYEDGNGQLQLAYMAATLSPSPSWDGLSHGAICDNCTPNSTATENYNFTGQQTLIQGGLSEGLPGEFWATDFASDGTTTTDSIHIYKGAMSSCNSSWARVETFTTNWNLSSTGNPIASGPNIAFSPDGNTGYMVVVGDMQGGPVDSILTPIVSKTDDGGQTWSQPTEIDLSGIPWIVDSLQSFWGQTGPNNSIIPVSAGKYTCTGEFDITVDANGNLHLINILASGYALDSDSVVIPVPPYSIYPGLAKMAVDITTPDQGATWDAKYIAPVMAWQGVFGQTNTETFGNYPQISRTDSGDKVFYSWADQDSTQGLFGISDLIAPNLRISACRITDGYQTCWKMITDGDFLWEGRVLCPTMAPTVLDYGSTYMMPIVVVELTANDVLQSCRFYYFGLDALIFDTDFQDPASLNLAFSSGCYGVGIGPDPMAHSLLEIQDLWPNPSEGKWQFKYRLDQTADVTLELYNLQGQLMGQRQVQSQAAGEIVESVSREDLSNGIYLVKVSASNESGQTASATRRIVVQH